MVRQKKRSRKFLGSRSHGKGNAKNRRGKGNKGGWGRAGMHKHRFTYITAREPDFFGVHGFSSLRKKKMKTVNLYQIEQMAISGKLEKRDGKDYFEFEGKVLGTGTITKPVVVKAAAFSEGAAEKISKAGGSASTFESESGKA
ncbi:MAG: 50S ribosomal protein L15 [Candidatus Micrarchaeota archaeon]|nr:50S ribosomal protein L15 [Candidatus Micrarchaeota archaeon]